MLAIGIQSKILFLRPRGCEHRRRRRISPGLCLGPARVFLRSEDTHLSLPSLSLPLSLSFFSGGTFLLFHLPVRPVSLSLLVPRSTKNHHTGQVTTISCFSVSLYLSLFLFLSFFLSLPAGSRIFRKTVYFKDSLLLDRKKRRSGDNRGIVEMT